MGQPQASSSEELGSTRELGQELLLCPGVGWRQMGHLYSEHSFNPCPSSLQRIQSRWLSLMTIGIWGNSGQSPSECSKDWQMRQGNGVETLLGEVKGVSSSHCFPLLIILTGSIGHM